MSNGATPPPVMPSEGMTALVPGARIRGYLLEERIGRGGMAVVFRAFDERLNRQVALKVMAPSHSLDEAFRLRFIRESQAAAAVDDPHIIPVYEAGDADGMLFIAMRLVRGGDLRTLVRRHGPLEPSRAEWILSGVASALDAAHARGLVHRDVKPANMLLDVRAGRPDHVYLSDFGVSKAALDTSDLSGSGQFLGTVDYAAPEQIHGRRVDGQTDQYALGCSAYELLCGRPPFAGKDLVAVMFAQVATLPPKPSTVIGDLPAAVDDVFARALAKSPDERYDSCLDFARALRSALGLPSYAVEDPFPLASVGASEDGDDDTLDPADVRKHVIRAKEAVSGGRAAAGSAAGLADTERLATERAGGQATGGPRVPSGGRRPWRKLLPVLLALVALVAGVAVALVLGRGSRQTSAAYLSFLPSYSGGLGVSQAWELTGRGGSTLDVTMTVTSKLSRQVTAQLEEPIPAAVAQDPRSVHFRPGSSPRTEFAGTALVVAVWDFPLPAGGSKQLSFSVPEPADGVTQRRLMMLADAYTEVGNLQVLQVVKRGELPGLKHVVISPRRAELGIGESAQLTLLVPESKLTAKLRRELSTAVWHSNHPAAVIVNSHGLVTGVAPGIARVTAKFDSMTASAYVTVLPPGSSPSVGQQPVPAPPGGQTTPITTPSFTLTPSTSPSVSPSSSTTGSGSPSSSPSGSPPSSSSGSPSPSDAATG